MKRDEVEAKREQMEMLRGQRRKEEDDYREEKWWILTILIFMACLLFWVAVIKWIM